MTLKELKLEILRLEKRYKTVNGIFKDDIQNISKAHSEAQMLKGPRIEKLTNTNGKKEIKLSAAFVILQTAIILGFSAGLVYWGFVDFSMFKGLTTDFTQQSSLLHTFVLPYLITALFLSLIVLIAIYPVLAIYAKVLDSTLQTADQSLQLLNDSKYSTNLLSSTMNKLNIECIDLLSEIEKIKKRSGDDLQVELNEMYENLSKTSQIINYYVFTIISSLSR